MLEVQDLYPIATSLGNMKYQDWLPIIIGLNRTYHLPHFLELINRTYLYNALRPVLLNSQGKILIIGDTKLKDQDIEKTCINCGISKQRLEIVSEYKNNYDFKNTQYTDKYAAILVGPLPHMALGVDGASSIISKIENGDGYPPVIRMTDSNNQLHISKNSIKEALNTAIKSGYVTVG